MSRKYKNPYELDFKRHAWATVVSVDGRTFVDHNIYTTKGAAIENAQYWRHKHEAKAKVIKVRITPVAASDA
jgi:hypothetical protein